MAKKTKIELEYIIRVSFKILYNSLSTPSGLSGWFCDDVNIRGDIYTFIWSDSEQQAKLLNKKDGASIKFHWIDDEDEDTYFEFVVKRDDITSDVLLYITDFVEEDEVEETRLLWDSQVSDLKHMLGSH